VSRRVLLPQILVFVLFAGGGRAEEPNPPRVVALNPSLTATLLALGARDALVGVDDYSAQLEPRVRDLPRVGGLFNPSLEAIVGLEPDVVTMVPSAQHRSLRERLEALDIEVLAHSNVGFDELLESIEALGARVGRGEAAGERIAAIRAAFEIERDPSAPRPTAVLVIQRDPLYVVGGGSFLDAMLRAAGVRNAGSEFAEPFPRVSVEWLIEAAPELILDAAEPPEAAHEHWARWPSLRAVAKGGVVTIAGDGIILPGPYLDHSLRRLEARIAEVAR